MKDMYKANAMWEKIQKDNLKKYDLEHFRESSSPNNRFATSYNTSTHSVLFFKTILFNMCLDLSQKDKECLRKIQKRDCGNPLSVNFENDLNVDIDYLQALNEIKFIDDILKNSNYILEIGAGYGRTAHSILSLYSEIEKYFIIDLDATLILARDFLKTVLPYDLFSKIVFLNTSSVNEFFEKNSADLCININSFQEMSPDVIHHYMNLIDKKCKWFYSNNTVGKFSPALCGFKENTSSKNALSSGLLQNKINIFNFKDLTTARENFVNIFKPSNLWKCVKHASCVPWPHYYQALYKKIS